jgi:hypothetical protein
MLEITGAGTGREETGGVVSQRQLDAQCLHSGMAQLNAQDAGSSLAAAVTVRIETDVSHTWWRLAQLAELHGVEMRS